MEATTTELPYSDNSPQFAPKDDTAVDLDNPLFSDGITNSKNIIHTENPENPDHSYPNAQVTSFGAIGQPHVRSASNFNGPIHGHGTISERQRQVRNSSAADLKSQGPTIQKDLMEAENKVQGNTLSFKQFVFRNAASASAFSSHELTNVKGRTGPLSLDSRDRTKSVKEAGGACWRCKICGKGCDPGDPCSSCPQKSTPWHTLGCRRGTLSEVLSPVNICPQAGVESRPTRPTATIEDEAMIQSANDHVLKRIEKRDELIAKAEFSHNDFVEYVGQKPQGDTSRKKLLHHTLLAIAWEIEHNSSAVGGMKLGIPPSKDESNFALPDLLSCATNYQIKTANNQLIEISLFCLQSALEVIQVQEQGELRTFEHATCTPSKCKIDSYQKLKSHLDDYLDSLSKVIFKKNAKLRKDWWLSTFYSLCIQSIVRRVLVVITSKLRNPVEPDLRLAALQYLHLAVQLFFATCKATGKGYEPLSYDFENLSAVEMTALTRHSLQAYDGKIAQKAVQKEAWQSQNISSAYDYLGLLFEMDRAIFALPMPRPPLYRAPFWDDELETVVEEGTVRRPKKRRVCKGPEDYTGKDSVLTQIPDAPITHPGSLALLHFTDEMPPSVSSDDDSVRENEVRFEGDMFTPRWVRGYREEEEGWCGFCSSWLKHGDAWRNDRTLFHGICAETGRSLEDPKEPVRINSLKQIWKARCDICGAWVTYRKSDRKHYSAWYVHAVNCGDDNPMVENGDEMEGDISVVALE